MWGRELSPSTISHGENYFVTLKPLTDCTPTYCNNNILRSTIVSFPMEKSTMPTRLTRATQYLLYSYVLYDVIIPLPTSERQFLYHFGLLSNRVFHPWDALRAQRVRFTHHRLATFLTILCNLYFILFTILRLADVSLRKILYTYYLILDIWFLLYNNNLYNWKRL